MQVGISQNKQLSGLCVPLECTVDKYKFTNFDNDVSKTSVAIMSGGNCYINLFMRYLNKLKKLRNPFYK